MKSMFFNANFFLVCLVLALNSHEVISAPQAAASAADSSDQAASSVPAAGAAAGAGGAAAASGTQQVNPHMGILSGIQGIVSSSMSIPSMTLNTIQTSLGALGLPAAATAPLGAVSSFLSQG